jgi:hypothetical protein
MPELAPPLIIAAGICQAIAFSFNINAHAADEIIFLSPFGRRPRCSTAGFKRLTHH